MPSGHGPPPSFYSKSDPVPHDAPSNGERRSSGREQQPQAGGLSAAQAYQASTGYHSSSSPASMVFPHRAPGHSQGESMRSSAYSTSQSPPLAKRPSVGNVAEEGGYVNSLGKMNLGPSGSRPLDGVGGIPRIGEFSDFGSFETDFSGESRIYTEIAILTRQPRRIVHYRTNQAVINLGSHRYQVWPVVERIGEWHRTPH